MYPEAPGSPNSPDTPDILNLRDNRDSGDSSDAHLRRIAKRRVDLKMGFYTHLLVYVCVNLGLFTLNHLVGGVRWSVFPALGWGLGLAIHGIVVAVQLMGGSDLRERMLQQEIERLKQRR